MDKYHPYISIGDTIVCMETKVKGDSILALIVRGCKDGNVDLVRSAIEDYEKDASNDIVAPIADILLWNPYKPTGPKYIIEMAACCFNTEILALILEKNHFRIRRNSSRTPIHFLIKQNGNKMQEMHSMKTMLTMLCDAGFGINDLDHTGKTPLHYVCKNCG